MSVARRERAALVDTLRAVGPDAPTLCEGWTTRDLTAHLVLREYRPDASPGIGVRPLAGYTARVQAAITASTGWDELLNKIASGPPVYSPLKLLDPFVNVAEFFVHHEDVRRAVPKWKPRDLDSATSAALRRTLTMLPRLTMGKAPARVALRTPDGVTVATVGAGPDVTITGDPGELLLFAFGRNEVVAEFNGNPTDVIAVKDGKRGL
jgi:uncharacterized protein (TIGR03085 family)